jgi:hypothetical protein
MAADTNTNSKFHQNLSHVFIYWLRDKAQMTLIFTSHKKSPHQWAFKNEY